MSIEEDFTVFACGRCLRSLEQDSRKLLSTIKETIKDNLTSKAFNEFLEKITQLRAKAIRLLEAVHAEDIGEETITHRRLGKRVDMHLRHAEQRLQKWKLLVSQVEKAAEDESMRGVEQHIQDIFNVKDFSDYFCTIEEMQKVLKNVDKAVEAIESKFGPMDPVCNLLIGRMVQTKLCRSILDQLKSKKVLMTWSNIRKSLQDWIKSSEEIESMRINQSRPATCYACRKHHILLFCPEFRYMNLSDRWKLIKRVKICANCFSAHHSSNNCNKPYRCTTCGECHHTLLHPMNRVTLEL